MSLRSSPDNEIPLPSGNTWAVPGMDTIHVSSNVDMERKQRKPDVIRGTSLLDHAGDKIMVESASIPQPRSNAMGSACWEMTQDMLRDDIRQQLQWTLIQTDFLDQLLFIGCRIQILR